MKLNLNEITSILIGVYTLLALVAFKVINFNPLKTNFITRHIHNGYSFLRHEQVNSSFLNIVLNSGVCPFGKFGITVLVIWSIILISLLLTYKEENKQDVFRYLGIVNLALFVIYGGATLLMNWPLFVRCIPYLLIQLGVSIWLYSSYPNTSR